MTDQRPKNPLTAALEEMAERQRTAAQAEGARRARLTPDQRAAEDQAAALARAAAADTVARRALAKLGPDVWRRESWTLAEFAWLLLGKAPSRSGTGLLIDPDRDRHSEIHRILASCVGTSLQPIEPAEPVDQWRFRIPDLLRVAAAKDLGMHLAIAERYRHGTSAAPAATGPAATHRDQLRPAVTGPDRSPPVPEPVRSSGGAAQAPARAAAHPPVTATPGRTAGVDSLTRAGTQSRERTSAERRRHWKDFAIELVDAGQGSRTPERVRLSIKAEDLDRAFQARHPEWKNVSPRTLKRDRTSCLPPIELTAGRRRTAAKD